MDVGWAQGSHPRAGKEGLTQPRASLGQAEPLPMLTSHQGPLSQILGFCSMFCSIINGPEVLLLSAWQ